MLMKILITAFILFLAIGIFYLYILPYYIKKNSTLPDAKRQWTDPKSNG